MNSTEKRRWSLRFKRFAQLLVMAAAVALVYAGVGVIQVARENVRLGRVQGTLSEIGEIERALKLTSADGACSELSCFLEPEAIRTALGVPYGASISAQQMQTAIEVYSNVFGRLLRSGRFVLDDAEVEPATRVPYRALVNTARVRKLGAGYTKICADPWGTQYRIFPGPWPESNGPIPFRSAWPRVGEENPAVGKPDVLTIHDAVVPGWLFNKERLAISGLPVRGDRFVYIWSLGKDLLSGQALYSPEGYAGSPRMQYVSSETGNLDAIGGGDDVNNWDQNQYYDF